MSEPDNPARGWCDITAALRNNLFGGVLVMREVHHAGERHGLHWWNRLPTGIDLDLTREQFRPGQTVPDVWVVYQLLRERVARRLGPLPGPAQPTD